MFKINNVTLKNSVFSVLQIVLSSLSYVVVYFLILNKLGKDELGVWSIITSLPIAISVFGSGVSGCVLRYVPIYKVQENKIKFNEIIFNGLLFNFIFGGIIVCLGFFFSTEVLEFLFSNKDLPVRYIPLFHLSLFTFYFNFISSVLLFSIDGLQLIFLRNKIVIYCSLVFCLAAVFGVFYFGLKGILLAQLIQSIMLFVLAIRIIIKTELFDILLFKVNKSFFKMFLTYGQGFQVISITILVFDPLTKYFLNKYFNLSTVGIYDLVSRAVTQIRVLIVSAVQVITPLITTSNEEKVLDLSGIYKKTIRGASLLSFVLFSSLICFSMILVGYLDSSNINQYLFNFLFLCIAYHYNILASTAYSILMGLGKLKNIIVSHILSSLINIILFLSIGKYILDDFIILPIAIAIIISSFYLIITFEKNYHIQAKVVNKSDLYIQILSIVTVLLTSFLVFFEFNYTFMFYLFFTYLIFMLFLVRKNDFFITIFNKILNR